MSTLGLVWVVAVREIRERVRSRAFIVSVAILVLIVVMALVVVPVLAGGLAARERRSSVGLVDVTGPALEALESLGGDGQVRLRWFRDRGEAEEAIRDNQVDLVVVGGDRILVRRISGETAPLVEETTRVLRVAAAAQASEDPDAVLQAGLREDSVSVRSLDPLNGERAGRLGLGGVSAFILFILVALSSGLILTGVVEEKSSRVVELIVSAVGAPALLAGKVLGVAVLGLVQLMLLLSPALVGGAQAAVAGLVPWGWGAVAGLLVLWFLLGYAFFAYLLAAMGSLVSRMEDLQYSAMPLMLILFGSFYAVLPVLGDPGGTTAVVLSFVPPTAPGVMLVRVAAGAAPWWQVLLSVATMAAATVLVARLGARIYSVGILQQGRRLKLRQALRTARA